MSNSGGLWPKGGFHTRLPMVLPTRHSREGLTTKKTSADIGPLRLAPFDKLQAPKSPPKSQEAIAKNEESDCDDIIIVESDLDGTDDTKGVVVTIINYPMHWSTSTVKPIAAKCGKIKFLNKSGP